MRNRPDWAARVAFAAAVAIAALAGSPGSAGGGAPGAAPAPVPPRTIVPVAFHVAHLAAEGSAAAPVLENAFLDAMLERAGELLGGAGVCFAPAAPGTARALAPGTHLDLVTRADRHALAAAAPHAAGALNVFVVRSVADVDVRGGVLAGVHWRWTGKGKAHAGRRYVILSATGSGLDTLAHEIGHFLGLGHAVDPRNLMTPASSREATELTAAQRARIAKTLAAAIRRGELAPLAAAGATCS